MKFDSERSLVFKTKDGRAISALELIREKRRMANEQNKPEETSKEGKEILQKEEIKDRMDGAELLRMGISKLPSLVNPIIPKVGLGALIGTSDIGKSTILLQLCCDIVFKESFIGFPLTPMHKSTIYVSTEDDQYLISNRLQRFIGAEEEKLKNLRFIFDTTKLLDKLDKELTNQKADLVVIDTFADIFDGEMNQINQVRSFLNDFQNLITKHECAIVFNHHTGKNTEEKPPSKNNSIGSAGFEGKARVVIELRPDYEDVSKRHFCIVKGNYLSSEYKNRSFELSFTQEQGFINTGKRKDFEELVKPKILKGNPDKATVQALVLQLHKEGKTTREIEELLKNDGYKVSKSKAAEIIKEAAVQ